MSSFSPFLFFIFLPFSNPSSPEVSETVIKVPIPLPVLPHILVFSVILEHLPLFVRKCVAAPTTGLTLFPVPGCRVCDPVVLCPYPYHMFDDGSLGCAIILSLHQGIWMLRLPPCPSPSFPHSHFTSPIPACIHSCMQKHDL